MVKTFVENFAQSANPLLRTAALNAEKYMSLKEPEFVQVNHEDQEKHMQLIEKAKTLLGELDTTVPIQALAGDGLRAFLQYSAFEQRVSMLHPNNGYFGVLPDEIVGLICCFVEKLDSIASTCKRIRNIARTLVGHTARFRINNVSAYMDGKTYLTPPKSIANHKWTVQFGDTTNTSQRHFSLFAKPINDVNAVAAQFRISLVNQKKRGHDGQPEMVSSVTEHMFTVGEACWGWKKFADLAKMEDPEAGWIVDNSIEVVLTILFCRELEGFGRYKVPVRNQYHYLP